MTLIALTDEQRAELKTALHFLITKGELQRLQGIEISQEFLDNLRAIQNQVLHPFRIDVEYDGFTDDDGTRDYCFLTTEEVRIENGRIVITEV